MFFVIPALRECQKTQVVLSLPLEVATHLFPKLKETIFSSRLQSKSFFLYNGIPLNYFCFCFPVSESEKYGKYRMCHFPDSFRSLNSCFSKTTAMNSWTKFQWNPIHLWGGFIWKVLISILAYFNSFWLILTYFNSIQKLPNVLTKVTPLDVWTHVFVTGGFNFPIKVSMELFILVEEDSFPKSIHFILCIRILIFQKT